MLKATNSLFEYFLFFVLKVNYTYSFYISVCGVLLELKMAFLYTTTITTGSRDSVVGIATRYGLEGPGIESRLGEIFRTYPDRLRGPPSLLYNGYLVFPGGKGGRG
jgi:hypothetical protein